jgi:TonB family protein
MRARVVRYLMVLSLVSFIGASAAILQDGPEARKRVNPVYPSLLKAAGIEGEAILKVMIDETGKVAKTEALKYTHPAFVDAATEAVKQWEFSPSIKDGQAIKAEVTIPFKFKLGEGSDKSRHEDLLLLQEDVKKLVRGEPADLVKSRIGTSAYIIIDNEQEFLPSFISEKRKRDLLVGGKSCTIESTRSIVGNAEDMAYFVLKTRPDGGKKERYHTLVFAKSSEGKWTISAWHAGS